MSEAAVDLDAYFARIGYSGSRTATLDVLSTLQRLHPLAIPFENLSVLLGTAPPLDVESIEAKLVHSGRGGYCFEHNRLFTAVLDALGFEVQSLAARVLWEGGLQAVRPRTHRLLAVRVDGHVRMADVGFGGSTPTAPLRLDIEAPQSTPHERYRVTPHDHGYLLQIEMGADWRPMYKFDLAPQLEVDFEMANHFVATHPDSKFRLHLTAARALADGRLAMFDNRVTIRRVGHETQILLLTNACEMERVLTKDFAIALPESSALETLLNKLADTQWESPET